MELVLQNMILLSFHRYLCHDEFLTAEGACHLQEHGQQGVKASYFQQNVCGFWLCSCTCSHTHLWLDGRSKSVFVKRPRVCTWETLQMCWRCACMRDNSSIKHCICVWVCVYSPGWCVASTAMCVCAGDEGWRGDRRCVHLPRSARLLPPPCTAAQKGLKNAGSPSVESEGAVVTHKKRGRGCGSDTD